MRREEESRPCVLIMKLNQSILHGSVLLEPQGHELPNHMTVRLLAVHNMTWRQSKIIFLWCYTLMLIY